MAAELPAAVLWDMDGTLVDTEPYWIRAESDLVSAYGGVWTDELAHRCVGNPLLTSAQIIRENSPVTLPPEEIVDRLLTEVIQRMRRHVPWRPGARELLTGLVGRGVPCALVTMSWTSLAKVLVDAAGDGIFDVVMTGDQVTRGKPDPEIYLRAVDALGVDASDCVAIEDSPPGVRSAVAAGCPTIAVPHIVEVPPIAGAVQVDSLQELSVETLLARARGARDGRGLHRPRASAAATIAQPAENTSR